MMSVADEPDGTVVTDRPEAAGPQERVASVDALRGLVILLMIFVNDVAGVGRVPSWLKHVSAEADAMTLPDIVFPAFLFIAGIAGIRIGFYKSPELPVFVNILGCLTMAFFVVGLTGLITRLGYRMRA